ncbi:MAG: helix-turn-helix transcriptional regulator [Planctomycetes bacterium]|nr:helix-turn-helix transcriptional regulator [Planctomycetota bacterium]MCW8135566.1 helix-turn-helix transcriptional regulator [Planctomycetota bacterium]
MKAASETDALRKRLALLAQGRSQSEIARKTGTSVANVNRYLKGTRMSAEFCAALVKGLGVNPAWLLAGEGTPFVSDITAGTASMAGNLLELVEAMNAVSQMRLGALTGKHHLGVLRGLNDALTTYETLRKRLNEQSAPIFSQLLADIERAMSKFETVRAADLLKAAEQVARLCDEPALKHKLLELQAQHMFFGSRHAEALEYQRRIMLEPLTRGAIIDEAGCRTIARFVLTLHTLNRLPEALKVCEASLVLLGPERAHFQGYGMLEFLFGRINAEVGELLAGLEIMTRAMPREGPNRDVALRLWITPHLLRAGLLRPQDALAFGENIGPKAVMLLQYACWLEDADYLKRVCDFALDERHERLGDLVRPALLGPYLLRAIQRKDRAAPREFAAVAAQAPEGVREHPDIFLCQIWRCIGDRKQAAAHFDTAQSRIAAMTSDIFIDLLIMGTHHRNALWLAEKNERYQAAAERARAFFREYESRGFVCFRDVG